VFRGEVLEWLARNASHVDMLRWRHVCKRWAVWITQIQHLYIELDYYIDKEIYGSRLLGRFPLVKSLSINVVVLATDTSDLATRVTELEVRPISQWGDRTQLEYPLHHWTCLQNLSLLTGWNYRYAGLPALTQLTSLKCTSDAFGETTNLTRLTNLTNLSIRGFPDTLAMTPLTLLTRLESDQPTHFAQFNGHGVLNAHASVYDTVLKKALQIYGTDCYRVVLDGRWCAGVFSGSAYAGYHGETGTSLFIGSFVDGHRDGKAKEYDASRGLVRQGQWVQGKRHGIAICNRVSSVGRDTGQQMAFERWDHGVLIERVELGDVDSASQWVDANYG
jgi:hypothetical protein